jgi:hypothetical protein
MSQKLVYVAGCDFEKFKRLIHPTILSMLHPAEVVFGQ